MIIISNNPPLPVHKEENSEEPNPTITAFIQLYDEIEHILKIQFMCNTEEQITFSVVKKRKKSVDVMSIPY